MWSNMVRGICRWGTRIYLFSMPLRSHDGLADIRVSHKAAVKGLLAFLLISALQSQTLCKIPWLNFRYFKLL